MNLVSRRYAAALAATVLLAWAAAIAFAAAGSSIDSAFAAARPNFKLARVASGFNQPVHVAFAPGDSRPYVVERSGRIRVISNGRVRTFLDIRGRVGSSSGEQGLLSVAFHPRYASNRRLFVNFTDTRGDTRVVEFRAPRGRVSLASARRLLLINQPFDNHNGGLLLFTPGGHLLIGTGDGGGAGDPQARAQNRRSLLGKLLRIDVNHGRPYSVPSSNPYAKSSRYRREIYHLGLRNPWRFSFDRATGDLFVGDVGQSRREEISRVRAGASLGRNFGWDAWEGSLRFEHKRTLGTLVSPVHEYSHSGGGCSVTGGYVYRGSAIPRLRGMYLYADLCTRWIKGFRMSGGRALQHQTFAGTSGIVSFAQTTRGELYVASIDGAIYRIVPR